MDFEHLRPKNPYHAPALTYHNEGEHNKWVAYEEGAIDYAKAADPVLTALYGALEAVEWVGLYPSCPICGRNKAQWDGKHTGFCGMAKALELATPPATQGKETSDE